jgi:hypothetical protein
MDRDYLIGEYFKLGLKYSEIIKCLEELHGYIIGIITLIRITKIFGLFNQIIWRENPSIQPWIFIPYLESLSYPSMCQTEFGPLLEYTRLLILLFLCT